MSLNVPKRIVPQALGLLLAFFGSRIILWILRPLGFDPPNFRSAVLADVSVDWVITAALVGVVLAWERLPLNSMGRWLPNWADVGWAMAYFVASFTLGPPTLLAVALWWRIRPFRERPLGEVRSATALWLIGLVVTVAGVLYTMDRLDLGQAREISEGKAAFDALPIWVMALARLSAAITEEVAYRGYGITRIQALTGHVWIGALISYVVFVVSHIPFFGMDHVLRSTAIGAITLPLLFVHRRSLGACILLHAAFNSLGLVSRIA